MVTARAREFWMFRSLFLSGTVEDILPFTRGSRVWQRQTDRHSEIKYCASAGCAAKNFRW